MKPKNSAPMMKTRILLWFVTAAVLLTAGYRGFSLFYVMPTAEGPFQLWIDYASASSTRNKYGFTPYSGDQNKRYLTQTTTEDAYGVTYSSPTLSNTESFSTIKNCCPGTWEWDDTGLWVNFTVASVIYLKYQNAQS